MGETEIGPLPIPSHRYETDLTEIAGESPGREEFA
jgi:hypothetical protein